MRSKPLLLVTCVCLLPLSGRADEMVVTVHADETRFTLSDMMIGVNMEDLHYQMVGGLDSQMLHGESFFEHSPTELAPRKSQLDGFTTVNGVWAAADGVVTVVVRPTDGTPWVEAGLDGGQPPAAPSDAPAKDPGARLTSLEPAAPDAVATRASFRFPAGEDRPAGLIAHVHPNHSDNGWNWYSGYTVELDPQAQKVRLLAALRANKHQELGAAQVSIDRDVWLPVELRRDGPRLVVRVADRDVISCPAERLLPLGHFGITARGCVQIRDLAVDAEPVALRPNPLLTAPSDALSLRWAPVQTETARGSFAFDPEGWHPGLRSQQIIFESGEGEFGCDNAGLQRSGLALHAGRDYEGFLRVKTLAPVEVVVSLRGSDGQTILAEKALRTGAGREFQQLAFSLIPSATDLKGRFAITLRQPGRATIGYAFLQPGKWGRYKGLPVRKDLAEAILAQGIGVLRFNGGMIEVPGYRWRNLRGPRDQRPPYNGFYDRYCSSGFGPAEVVAFGKAAELPVVPALNLDETPEDVADFVSTCRPQFYQHGNESRFDRAYVDKFKAVAEAVWKVAPDITLITTSTVPAVKATDAEDTVRGRLALHLELAAFAHEWGQRIMFDSHSFKGAAAVEGIAAFARWLHRLAPDPAAVSVGILEFNAGAFDFQRGLNHALEMNAAHRAGDVIRAVGTPNVSQPWEVYQSDWKAVLWTQGNIYYAADKIWFQPAYYVDQMVARHWASAAVAVDISASPQGLDIFAAKTADGARLVLRVVNANPTAQAARFDIRGAALAQSTAHVTTLAHDDLMGFNTLGEPERIKPVTSQWLPEGNPVSRTFPPQSFTIIDLPLEMKKEKDRSSR
jgi:hypothetical protein